jgi:MerR family transcriptional regulator, light-induced transcriptional regulator
MDRMTLLEPGETVSLNELTARLKLPVPKVAPMPVDNELPGAAHFPDAQERLAQIVRTIESDIIPRLLRAHPAEVAPALSRSLADAPQVDTVAVFASLVLAVNDEAWADSVECHLARGVCSETLCMELLVPTARELGRLWDEDLISLADVTMAVGRLQRAMRVLASEFDGSSSASGQDGRRILLMVMPGDTHTFGISMVAEFFRRAGWEVVGHSDARCDDPLALVSQEWFDVVGISVGDGTRLESMPVLIARLRQASRNNTLAVLLGGPVALLDDALVDQVGADGVATDARLAPALAQKMLESRTGRLAVASS